MRDVATGKEISQGASPKFEKRSVAPSPVALEGGLLVVILKGRKKGQATVARAMRDSLPGGQRGEIVGRGDNLALAKALNSANESRALVCEAAGFGAIESLRQAMDLLTNPRIAVAGLAVEGRLNPRHCVLRLSALRVAGGWPEGYEELDIAAHDASLRLRKNRYSLAPLPGQELGGRSRRTVSENDAKAFLAEWGIKPLAKEKLFPAAAVSVIIPTYNHGPFLERCIESCYAQEGLAEDPEVVIVDDGSDDGTWDQLKAWKSHRWPNLLLLRQANSGLSAARNRAMQRATGAVLVFQDADDVMPPDRVARSLEALESCELVFGHVQGFDQDDDPQDPACRKDHRIARQPRADTVQNGCGFWVGTAAVRSEFLDEHEIEFDEQMAGLEDQEFFWHVVARGGRVEALDEILLWRRDTFGSLRQRVDMQVLRSYVMEKHGALLEHMSTTGQLPCETGVVLQPRPAELPVDPHELTPTVRSGVPPPTPQPRLPTISVQPTPRGEWIGGVATYIRELRRFLSFPQTDNVAEADIVHWNPWAEGEDGKLVVATTHGIYLPEVFPPDENPDKVKMNERLLGVYKNSMAVIAVSKWFRDYLEENYDITALHIPNAVDTAQFAPDGDGDYVLWVGYDDRVKRTQDLFELAGKLPGWRFVACGPNITPERFPGAPENVELAGPVPRERIRKLMGGCRFLLATSGREQCPTVVLEAFASGKPVVGWRHYGVADLVTHRKTGWLAKPYSIPMLTKMARRAWEEAPGLRDACLTEALEYDWRVVARRIEQVYLDCWRLPVSTVTLCHGNRDTLRRAIDSAGHRCEVIVGDADGTHRDLVPAHCKYIRVPNKSVADNYNRCIEAATRPYIAIIDGDDYRYPETLPGQVRHLDEHPETGVVFSGVVTSLGQNRSGGNTPHRVQRREFERGNPVPNGSSLIRKEAWAAVGGFFPMVYAEDYDCYWRIWDAGWEIDFLPGIAYQLTWREGSVTNRIGVVRHERAKIEIQKRGEERMAKGEVKQR